MAADILALLIKTNLATAAAILLILALRRPARRAFGARVAYALWLLAPLAAAASLFPARRVVVSLPETTALFLLPPTAEIPATAAPTVSSLDLATVAISLWLAGLVAFALLLIWRQQRFMQSLGAVHQEGRHLRAQASDAGPVVVGAWRPRVILPADFETRFDPREREVVLAHETTHLTMGDTRINALVAVIQCIAWFNPLVHLAARFLRLDQELACDAAVLARRPADRQLYAAALLKAQTHDRPVPVGCYWPAGANPLKERIMMMKSQHPSRRRVLAGSSLVAGLCVAAAATAWAAQPAKVVIQPMSKARLTLSAPEQGASQVSGSQPVADLPAVTLNADPDVRPVQLVQADTPARATGSPEAVRAPSAEFAPPPPRPTQITPRPAPVSPAVNIPLGMDQRANTPFANSTETPLSLVAKVASATSREDCLRLFPYLVNGTNAEKTQRINEQVTCLNRWNNAGPSLLRQYMDAQPSGDARSNDRPDNTGALNSTGVQSDQARRSGTSYIVIPNPLTTAGKAQLLQQVDAQIARTPAGSMRERLLAARDGVIQTPTTD